jgi:Tol biopolymer transport system component
VNGLRPSHLFAAAGALCLTAQAHGPFVTVPQHDRGRTLADSSTAGISADGRFVAFESYAQLVPADTDAHRDIYVLNRATGQVTLETASIIDGDASHPRLSGDGRWLVFEADSLIQNNVMLRINIVALDRSTGRMTTVRGVNGESLNGSNYSPEISDDGRLVVFSSTATNLVAAADANGGLEDVYAMDVASGAVTRVSVDGNGVQSSLGFSFSPSVSADGRLIAFVSSAPLNAAAARHASRGTHPSLRQVYVRDMTDGTTTLVSGAGDNWPDGASVRPAISGDGRFVAFGSDATNLVRDDRNRVADIFLHDRRAGTTTLISRSAEGGAANGRSMAPAISFDGRFIAFQSDASNLVCARRCSSSAEDINLLWDIFVWDRDRTAIVRVSDDLLGGWIEPSIGPALDAQGEVVAFASRHPIDSSDRENDFDLFVRELH